MSQKVLVVDDEPDMVDILKQKLSVHNYMVSTASDGKEALKKAVEDKPDLILLDIMMPEMNGIESLVKLKANPATRGIPVVMVTARAEIGMVFRSKELGSTDYIMKPVKLEELMGFVRKYINPVKI
jgi:two-component system phosphate regulon response regulator PhoB